MIRSNRFFFLPLSLSFALLSVAPGSANAQDDEAVAEVPQDGGVAPEMPQGMPDPRQMSGIPRVDGAVPAGTVTVRLVQGGLAFPAPASTTVHLVAVGANGSAVRLSKTVGAVSRAEFPTLKTDSSIVYYALSQLGEDRLESQEISPPPGAGVRVMLSGRKLDAQGKPVGAPIDDQAVTGQRVDQVPVGDVWIDLRGNSSFDEIELVEVGPPGAPEKSVAKAKVEKLRDGEGLATFKQVAAGPDRVFLARATAGGRRFQTRPFLGSTTTGTRIALVGVGQLLFGFHAGGQVDDDKIWFEAQLALANLTGAPYDPGPEGVFIPLPAGFANASIADETMSARIKIVPEKGLYWRGPIAPGQHEAQVQWSHQVQDGAVDFNLPTELGVAQGQVIVEYAPGSTVHGEGVTPQLKRTDSGRDFYVLAGLTVEPGRSLHFQIEGLPQASATARNMRVAVGVLVLGLLGFAVFSAIAAPARPAAPDPVARRKDLAARRATAFDELVRLAKKGGQSDEARNARVASLAALDREIDLIDTLAAKSKPKKGGS